MKISTFEHMIIDPIGIALSPFAGIIATPILMLGALYKTIEAWYHGQSVPMHCRQRDVTHYEPNLKGSDIQWLKSERLRLQAHDEANFLLATAKVTALLVIPVFGYIKVCYGDGLPNLPSNSTKISWLKWHIDILEGRLTKDSNYYKLGINLPE